MDGLFAGGMVFMLIMLAISVFLIAAMWKMFEKAGEPGWASIVPIYNLITLAKIIDKPPLWGLLFAIPLVNIIPNIELAKKFGKDQTFGILLALLSPIFIPMLGFGDAQYQGHEEGVPAMATARI